MKISINDFLNIINNAKNGEVMQIDVFADTDKITTLKLISEAMLDKKILYLVFNRSIQTEVASKLPENVVVRTIHWFAYQAIKLNTTLRLNDLRGDYKVAELSNILNIDYKTALKVEKDLNRFLNGKKEQSSNIYVNELFAKFLSNEIVPTHSMYLKQYQRLLLENTKANTQIINKINYDAILLDDAQNTNGVILSIFENLHPNLKGLVGDNHLQFWGS